MLLSLDMLKRSTTPYKLEEELDLSSFLLNTPGVKQASSVTVEGVITEVDSETYKFDFHLSCDLVLECARTLEDVSYSIADDFSDYYTSDPEFDGILIEDNQIDTSEAVLDAILINLPMRVVKSDSEFISDSEPEGENPFSKLKEFL